MKTALIKDGYITNVIQTEEGYVPPEGHTAMSFSQALSQGYQRAVSPFIPSPITPIQVRLQLIEEGLLPAAATYVNGLPNGPEKQIAQTKWEYASEIPREGPAINAVLTHLGKSPEEIDTFFRNAAAISPV